MSAIDLQRDFCYNPQYIRCEALCEDYNLFADWFRFIPKRIRSKLPLVPQVCFTPDNIVVFDLVRLECWYIALLNCKFSRFERASIVDSFNFLRDNCIVTSKV